MAGSSAPATERHRIDLREGDNLKILFDAGLRPLRSRGLETLECDIGKEDLAIVLPDGAGFDIDVDRAYFRLLEGNQLHEADLFGKTEVLRDALRHTREICRAAALSDAGLSEVAADLGMLPDPAKRWAQAGVKNDIRVWVTFYPMWLGDRVDAQVWVILQRSALLEG